jgi:hypothetical protein
VRTDSRTRNAHALVDFWFLSLSCLSVCGGGGGGGGIVATGDEMCERQAGSNGQC